MTSHQSIFTPSSATPSVLHVDLFRLTILTNIRAYKNYKFFKFLLMVGIRLVQTASDRVFNLQIQLPTTCSWAITQPAAPAIWQGVPNGITPNTMRMRFAHNREK